MSSLSLQEARRIEAACGTEDKMKCALNAASSASTAAQKGAEAHGWRKRDAFPGFR